MESHPNDQPPAPEPSGSGGVPFGTAKPFKPGAPKLKPAVAATADDAPVLPFKLTAKPAASAPPPRIPLPKLPAQPDPTATNPVTAASPLPGKLFPPKFTKPAPKLAPAIAKAGVAPSTPTSLQLPKPAAQAPPALFATATPPPQPTPEPDIPHEPEDDLDEIFREEVESYLPDIVRALHQLATDLDHADSWKELKTRYHAMKGAANTVGLPELGTCSAAAEKAALQAYENPECRTAECRDQLIDALKQITTPLQIPLPDIPPCSQTEVVPEASVTTKPQSDPIALETTADALEIAIPEIEPVIIAFKDWQQNSSAASREQFLAESERFRDSLDKIIFSGLYNSFTQLIEFCRQPIPVSPLPEIFCSVILHALNDARVYTQAKRFNHQLNWSRKWNFYFSSLQIALASHTGQSDQPAAARDPEMVEAFLEEAAENLEHIETALIALENEDQPAERQSELRRHFHTLKGAANSVGLTKLGADFHILEDAMDQAETTTAARDFLPHLFTCLDEARRYIELLQADVQAPWPGNWRALLHPEETSPVVANEMPEPIDPDMLEVFVEEAASLLEPIESAIMSLEAGDQVSEQQGILRRHFHTLKGAANSVGLTSIGAEFHALEDFMEGALDGTDSSALTSFLLQCLDHLRAYIQLLQDNPKSAWPYQWATRIESLKQGESPSSPEDAANSTPGAAAPKAPAAEKQMLRVEAGQLQELMHMISELVAEQSKIQHYVSGMRHLHSELQTMSGSPQLGAEIRAQIKSLAVQTHAIQDGLDNDDQLFRRYSKRIQSDLMELNMGPVGSLFHRLSRSFRDACQEENKEAKWVPEGGDVQLDRAVVDQLYGPLLHVVRNAVAHGIESPEQRQQVGKDPCGTVKIRAISKADHVILEISDDGAGISTAAVRKKAIEKGLLDSSVSEITSEEAVELLFSAGFSTKDAVSNVAGRGVGLDVVKGDIEGLNGSVGVLNTEGQGTTWVIRVPLTLSASEALLVKASEFKVALPLSMVDRCTGLSPGHMTGDCLLGKINIDEAPIPLLNLARFLGSTTAKAPTHAVVIDSGTGRAALAVTDLDARREIVMKDLGPLLTPLSFYSGVTSDVDGKLLPVMQIPNLLKWILKRDNLTQITAEDTADATAGPVTQLEAPINSEASADSDLARVLLADDSPSVRKVQEKQLAKLGFQVLLAKDGQEAIDILQHQTVDLLITDWEMPRVDGAALVQNTRRNKSTENLPIIVISSKVNDDFEVEANALGATACLAKPFQAGQFLDKLNSHPYLSPITAKLVAHGETEA